MIAPAATVWALTALGISFIVMVVYLLIFFTLLYVVSWPITLFVRAVASILSYE